MKTKKKKVKSFHPFELAFCGFSGAGKTTLIESLIGKLSSEYKIGYFKHDAHRFQMDREGKDTHRMSSAGAHHVAITSAEQTASIVNGELNDFDLKKLFINDDFLLIEGFKYGLHNKILILGEDSTSERLVEDFRANKIENVVAVVGIHSEAPDCFADRPYFHRDEINSIASFILNFFEKLQQIPTYGLILAGGKSTRMGSDKGALKYHQKFQTEHLHEILTSLCDQTYISCREEQREELHLSHLPQLHDQFLGIGPMGGILSAFNKHPNARWLVVAVDLPFLQEESLKRLLKEHNPFKLATCFLNPEKGWPEPLCTLYNPKARQRFLEFLAMEMSCPRKVLFNSEINALTLSGLDLENANTPEDFAKANQYISEGQIL